MCIHCGVLCVRIYVVLYIGCRSMYCFVLYTRCRSMYCVVLYIGCRCMYGISGVSACIAWHCMCVMHTVYVHMVEEKAMSVFGCGNRFGVRAE